jgi:hypothetical protein
MRMNRIFIHVILSIHLSSPFKNFTSLSSHLEVSEIDEQNYDEKYSIVMWSSINWPFGNLYREVSEIDEQNYGEK